ncbi:HAD family hydrolase [Sinimarinibacterium thermocellulolyticum]|uniref:HAD-IA family hydrolase n=1 Tax=Sinimarinibacterium thermocellulolyticum TaxID=3170016 RepID=A0ABV2AAY1_9GAMM
MKYELLIFDWDGTLADSAGQIVSAMQAAILGLGLPPREDQAIRELIGLGLDDVLARLYPELEPGGLRALLEGYRAKWLSAGTFEAPLFAGSIEAIRELRARGHRIAIATGKSRRGLDRSLRHHASLAELIVNSRCADETAAKPNPLMLRELLAAEGVTAERALMIGDTEYDMAMAQAIGMDGLGVACGVHDPGRLRRAGAAAVIATVAELPTWLFRAGDSRPRAAAGTAQ